MKTQELFTVLFLGLNSCLDLKKKEISLLFTGIYGVLGVLFTLMSGNDFKEHLLPVGIGIFFLGVSLLSGGGLGLGDGWILIALGTMLETGEYLQMLAGGMLLAAGVSAVLLVVFKKNRKTELPFVPFLFFAYLGGVLML